MEIVNFVRSPEGSYELALFDIELEGQFRGIPLNGFSLCRSKNGNLYVKAPQFRDRRIQGDKPYRAAIGLDGEKGREWGRKILELTTPLLEKNGITPVQSHEKSNVRSDSFGTYQDPPF